MAPKFVVRSAATVFAVTALFTTACSSDRPSPYAPRDSQVADGMATSELAKANANRHLIQVRHGKSVKALAARVRELGGRVERAHEGLGLVTARGLSPAALSMLSGHPDVLRMASDRTVRWIPKSFLKNARAAHVAKGAHHSQTIDQSGAQFFPFQWNIRVIRANNAWKITGEGRHALVCDLDTGIDPGHLDTKGRVDLGVSTSLVITEPDILDHNAHGTFVSALIASNGIGMASVAPGATLCQVKVLDQTGTGSFADVITGVVYATDAGADVINMSLGALLNEDDPAVLQLAAIFQDAVDYAHQHGVTVTASSGNDAVNLATADLIEIPAELRNVISVGATAPTGQQNFDNIASYSDFGFPGTTVFAPGGDFQPLAGGVVADLILSACSRFQTSLPFSCADGLTYFFDAGTSAAAPHVAAEAAILESDVPKYRAENAEPISKCIRNGTDRILTGNAYPDPLFGFGRINIIGGRDCRHILTM